MLHADFTALSYIEPDLLHIEVLHCKRISRFAAVTLTIHNGIMNFIAYTNLIRIPQDIPADQKN